MPKTVHGVAVVRVVDPGRLGTAREFTVGLQELVSGMRYFADLVAQKASCSQGREGPLEISVHCDVEVFAWLVRYVTGAVSRDQLNVEQVLALLIAGNFLQMDGLVSDCLTFMAQHLPEVARLQQLQAQKQPGGPAAAGAGAASGGGGDLTALPLELLSRLAKLVPEHVLEDMVREQPGTAAAAGGAAAGAGDGPRGSVHALVNKLYKYKLEGCLRELRTTLARCSVCQGLFSLADRGKLECSGSPHSRAATARDASGGRSHSARGARGGSTGAGRSGADGRAAPAVHIPDASWRLQDYLSALRAANAPWRDIYWHVWGLVHVIYCHACHQHVPAAGLRRCTYHPQAPVFAAAGPPRPGSAYAPAAAAAAASASGFYPCCGGAASRTADPRLAAASGCCAREHRLLPSGLGPGAPLPPGLSPALLDSLRRFPDLFTDAVDAPPPRAGAAAGQGRPLAPRASSGGGNAAPGSGLAAGDGSGAGAEAVPGAGAGAGAGAYAQPDLDCGDGRTVPPSIRAVLDAAAASAAASAAARRREAAVGAMAPQGLGPAAAAAAAALGYHIEPGPQKTGGGVVSSGKGAGGAVTAGTTVAAAAVPGSPLSLTGDPQLDARLVAAAVARRLTSSSGGAGAGGGAGAATAAVQATASNSTSKEVEKAHRRAGGPDVSHVRSFTSVAVLQQEAREAGAAPSGAAGAAQPPSHAPALRAARASSARYSDFDGGSGTGQGSTKRNRSLTASGQVPAAYLSSPYLPRPTTAKRSGRSSSLDAAVAKELQKLAAKLNDQQAGAATASQQQLAGGHAAAGGAAAASGPGLPPRPGSRAAIQLTAGAKAGQAGGAAAGAGGGWDSDEGVYTDEDDEQDEGEFGTEDEEEAEKGWHQGSPGQGNPLQRSVQAALARAQQRRHEQAQVHLQLPASQPPAGPLAHHHQHKHHQHQAEEGNSRSLPPPQAVTSPLPPRHPPAASPPVSPTPLSRPAQQDSNPGVMADSKSAHSPAQARGPGASRQLDAAMAAAAATAAVSGAAARMGPPLLHSAPVAGVGVPEYLADAERRQLIEAYKTQTVLSPRPAHYQMISIAELPSGGDLARAGAGAGGAAATAARLLAYRASGLGAALAAVTPGAPVAASVDLVGRPGGLTAAAGGGAPTASGLWTGAAAAGAPQALGRSWGPEASAAAAAAAAVEPGAAAVAASRAGFFSLPHPDYDSDTEQPVEGKDRSGGGAGAGGVTADSAAQGSRPDAPVTAAASAAVSATAAAGGNTWTAGAAAAGAAGSVASSSSGSAASGAKGRKLRMELLYEDDNYRMDVLLKHLLACRPSTRTSTSTAANSGGAGATKPGRGGSGGGGGGNTGLQRSMSRGHAAGAAGRPQSAAPLAPSGPGGQRQRARSVSHVQRLANLYQPAAVGGAGWQGPETSSAAAGAGAGSGAPAVAAPGQVRRPVSAAVRSYAVSPATAAAAVALGMEPGLFAGGRQEAGPAYAEGGGARGGGGGGRPEQGPYGSVTWHVDAGAPAGGAVSRAALPRTSSAVERRPVSAPRPRR
ncbi:hypothetical protein HYH02_004429 [Chlamydomonas schloesseri]|uniref:SANT and BTB domain-containing protein n=1 Tax=Chlamydomonas schloesseri TaxID=2026947 RepID=A0A835WNP1_9CHLO|nr:hypothetical protein HYH02_004429 [Chlamydomonas schloesseri]|eukprot:KAG2450589.1 hypothetical protein HYH02_004429 [Chlamydomonas schloesseri]